MKTIELSNPLDSTCSFTATIHYDNDFSVCTPAAGVVWFSESNADALISAIDECFCHGLINRLSDPAYPDIFVKLDRRHEIATLTQKWDDFRRDKDTVTVTRSQFEFLKESLDAP